MQRLMPILSPALTLNPMKDAAKVEAIVRQYSRLRKFIWSV